MFRFNFITSRLVLRSFPSTFRCNRSFTSSTYRSISGRLPKDSLEDPSDDTPGSKKATWPTLDDTLKHAEASTGVAESEKDNSSISGSKASQAITEKDKGSSEEKRRRGRPRKSETSTQKEDGPVGGTRPRGRPRKSQNEDELVEEKRKRGRPKKYVEGGANDTPKRSRRSPKTIKLVAEDSEGLLEGKTRKTRSRVSSKVSGEDQTEPKETKKTRKRRTADDLDGKAKKAQARPPKPPKEPKRLLKRTLTERAKDRIFKTTGSEDADRIVKYLSEAFGPHGEKNVNADWKRVNIVKKELCDDILDYMKPSLAKHSGCDIVDLNPGPCVWSSTLHEHIKPRTHILMEEDSELYGPYIQPLLDAEGSTYKLIPKSGLVWGHLQEALSPELLPNQPQLADGDKRLEEPNDTLLVVINLAYHPAKSYRLFSSMSTLFLYQLLSAVRSHSLFQKYGLVRMLIWMTDFEERAVLPKTIFERSKASLEAEVSCKKILEIASPDRKNISGARDPVLDLESARTVLERMRSKGISIPQNRQRSIQKELIANEDSSNTNRDDFVHRHWLVELADLEKKFSAGEFPEFLDGTLARDSFRTPEFLQMRTLERTLRSDEGLARKGNFNQVSNERQEELARLKARFAAGEFTEYRIPVSELPKQKTNTKTPEFKRMVSLRFKCRRADRRSEEYQRLIVEYDAIMQLHKELRFLEGSAAEQKTNKINQRTEDFLDAVGELNRDAGAFGVLLDNHRTFQQEPPLLLWDQREVEPLKVMPEEFFPQHELSLLDIQPRSLWPVLREYAPANYEVFEYIVGYLFASRSTSVREGLSGLAPGAFDWLVAECPTLTNMEKGGHPNLDLLTNRCLTIEMLKEIVEAWSRWPFKLARHEIMRRMGSEIWDPNDNDGDNPDEVNFGTYNYLDD